MDFFTGMWTIQPLPARAPVLATRDRLHARYTRWVTS